MNSVFLVVWSSGQVDAVVWQGGAVVQHIGFASWFHLLSHYGAVLPWLPNVRVVTTVTYNPFK